VGLTVGGDAVSDQIAALGDGRDPQTLQPGSPQLIFTSDGTTDANGNGFNFNGEPIVQTDLNLPGDRDVRIDNTGAPAIATPLADDASSTVGIQFAATGDTVAIIHHTGFANVEEGSVIQSEHFEIVRGERFSTVRWRDDGRVLGADGAEVEFEDLGNDVTLRNEFFSLLCTEVNGLSPTNTHTVCGPALEQPGAVRQIVLRRGTGRLVRSSDTFIRRGVKVRGIHTRATQRSLKRSILTPAGGRLIVNTPSVSSHRHVGRVSPRS